MPGDDHTILELDYSYACYSHMHGKESVFC